MKIQRALKTIATSILFFSQSQACFANSSYFLDFLKNYQVLSRQCEQSDTYCENIQSVNIEQISEKKFLVTELDQSGNKTITEVAEGNSENSSMFIYGSRGEFATWAKVVKNSDGQISHKDFLTISRDKYSPESPLHFDFFSQDFQTGSDSGGVKSYRRDYNLQ